MAKPWTGPTRLSLWALTALTAAASATELDLELIDLLPPFRKAAREGVLLYHPYDTHWNSAGRQRAAEHIATRLQRPGL